MDLVIYVLICWGLTNVITKGKIFEPIRNFFFDTPKLHFLSDLFNCPMCLGFWIGIGLSLLLYSPTAHYLSIIPIISAVADGFISSGTCWIIYCLLHKTGCYDL